MKNSRAGGDAISGSQVRLKSLELQGYKTFASKTIFEISPTITVIVGPNGSGKSNIADAIRWVLGEQSYSLLRGKKTEDMIFAGSEHRARAGMASATITFDNSDGWLPIDFSEVTIARRAYRDGQNEYLLNGEKVRLRDVTELLAQSGLAERTYTIIGQGLVDAALSLKVEERRKLFEEAAGIELYRSRREETLRRLEKTRRNLERVQDILAELKPRLRGLERQAQRAREFEQVRQDLLMALRTWYGHHWYRVQGLLSSARAEAGKHSAERDQLRMLQERSEESLAEIRSSLADSRRRLQELSQGSRDLYEAREQASRRLAVATERLRGLLDQQQLAREELESLHSAFGNTKAKAASLRSELGIIHSDLAAGTPPREPSPPPGPGGGPQRSMDRDQPSGLDRDLGSLSAKRASWEARSHKLQARWEDLAQSLQVAAEEWSDASEGARILGRQLEAARFELAWAEHRFAEAEREATEEDERLSALREALIEGKARLNEVREELVRAEARWEMVQKAYESGGDRRTAIIDGARLGRLQGVVGEFSKAIEVAGPYRRAIGAALGDFQDGLAFSTPQQIVEALRWLEARDLQGSAALLNLAAVRGPTRLSPPDFEGCLGVAADFVVASPRYRSLVEALLGRTLLVEDRETALRLLTRVPEDARLVTLAGEVFQLGGQVLLGRELAGDSIRSREAQSETELARYRSRLEAAETSLDQLSLRESEASRVSAGLGDRVERARNDVQETRLRLEGLRVSFQEAERRRLGLMERMTSLERLRAGLDRERQQAEAAVKDLDVQRQALEKRMADLGSESEAEGHSLRWVRAQVRRDRAQDQLRLEEERLQSLYQEIGTWRRRLQGSREAEQETREESETANQILSQVDERIAALSEATVAVESELREAEAEREALEATERRSRVSLSRAEAMTSQFQIEVARREEELASLERRIHDDFGLVTFEHDDDAVGQEPLPLEGLVEKLPMVRQLPPDLEIQVNRLRRQLRRVGAINPEAEREHREVRARVDFLVAQVEDLKGAEAQIQEVIAELDDLMKREFRATFERVDAEFRAAFTRLFGGGAARLTLTEPEDLTNTGIEIEARLPGRRTQGLSALSGGERSLTASALIFALIKTSPTPFCVLDEVDAMLDEVNVVRFCDMLRELSENTQFLVITHNRQTVQIGELVYGISMESDSISKVISLKLNEVEELIAA